LAVSTGHQFTALRCAGAGRRTRTALAGHRILRAQARSKTGRNSIVLLNARWVYLGCRWVGFYTPRKDVGHIHGHTFRAPPMRYDSRNEVESEVKAILDRQPTDRRRQVDQLAALVLKAYEEGERDGKRRERRRANEE
jgi:hypothetical protein